MGVVLQAFGLQLHGAAVLLDKLAKNKFQQRSPERNPPKNIPRRNDIDAAMIARDGGYRGERREPVFPRADDLAAHIG